MSSKIERLLEKYSSLLRRQKPNLTENHLLDSFLVESILDYPDSHPKVYNKKIEEKSNNKAFRYGVLRMLQRNRIKT